MAKPFDITLKHLLEAYPHDWLQLIGIPADCPVEILDADLATVSAEADKVFLIRDAELRLLNLELQSSYAAVLPDRMHFGGTLLTRRHDLPVQSVAILLRPEADGPTMTGKLTRRHFPGRTYLEFYYDVIRLWQLPFESFLTGGLGIVPLAPLALGAELHLEQVVGKMHDRLDMIADLEEQGSLWAASFVLMGLRYSREIADALFRGIHKMEESVTYQAIVEKGIAKGFSLGVVEGRNEGHVEAARELLVEVGTERFGPPPRAVLDAVNALNDYPRLKTLTKRLIEISGWDQLSAD